MKIRAWNTRGVARDIAAGRISQADAFGHFVGLSLLWVVNGYLAIFVTPPIEWLLLYEFFVVAAITIVGLRACFLANGGNEGKDFLLRFICISFPVEVKLFLLSWVLIAAIYAHPEMLVDPAVFSDPERAWTLLTFLWVAAFTGAFYWRVWHHLQWQHGAQQNVEIGV